MDKFRSQGGLQAADGHGNNMQLQVYSRSYSTPNQYQYQYQYPYEYDYSSRDANKKAAGRRSKSYKGWLSDPEFQRKKRVARYKSFTVERKVKGSVTKSFRWLKERYYRIVYGWW